MRPITRLYDSEAAAHQAEANLLEAEVPRDSILIISPVELNPSARVDEAIAREQLEPGHRTALIKALAEERWMVSSTPFFLIAGSAETAMDEAGPVDLQRLPEYIPDDPAPFSNWLGIPVLTRGESHTGLFEFNKDSAFGLRLISRSPTPLSSLFRMPLLTKNKGPIARGSAVERMSGKAAPFSSLLGLKLLTSGVARAPGSSVERLSSKPAPLSRFLGLPVLSKNH